jgi:hypothetical protein
MIVFTNLWTDDKIPWNVKVEDNGAFEKEKQNSSMGAIEVRMEKCD